MIYYIWVICEISINLEFTVEGKLTPEERSFRTWMLIEMDVFYSVILCNIIFLAIRAITPLAHNVVLVDERKQVP